MIVHGTLLVLLSVGGWGCAFAGAGEAGRQD
jgi:hypothetical protein